MYVSTKTRAGAWAARLVNSDKIVCICIVNWHVVGDVWRGPKAPEAIHGPHPHPLLLLVGLPSASVSCTPA